MVQIVFEPEENCSAAYADKQMIGECVYQDEGNQWIIVHTAVAPEYGHQGIARKLVMEVADQAKAKGITVIPVCWYAQKVLDPQR